MPSPSALRPLIPHSRYVFALAAALLLAACSRPAPPEEPVRSVKLLTVGVGALQSSLEYSGEVRARVESRLGFRVAGKIVQRQAELGQRVRAGQVLARWTRATTSLPPTRHVRRWRLPPRNAIWRQRI